MSLTRFCRGHVAAVVFLNKGELKALRDQARGFLGGDHAEDPLLKTLRRILDGLGEGKEPRDA